MGESSHPKHLFSNDFTKKSETIKKAVTFLVIISVILFASFQFDPFLDIKDRLTIGVASMAAVLSVSVAMVNWYLKNKQLQTQNLFKVFELLSSPEIRKAREKIHFIYRELKDKPPIIFSDTDGKDDADMILSALDQSSATVLNGLLDRDLFFDLYAEMTVREWKTFKDEIEHRQISNKKTLRHFTALKEEFEFRLKQNPDYKDSDIEPY